MVNIIGVRFRSAGKVYYFDIRAFELKPGDHVIVETARGPEYGIVATRARCVSDDMVAQPLRGVVRIATEDDERKRTELAEKEKEALRICREKVHKHNLEMKVVDAEYAFDGNRLLFYFTADGRIDFRDLVKDLASVFHTRIELRQIGVRDETRMLGGIGICGRELCCATYLNDFAPVSIKMAKEQNLSLNPGKISGICGRLMCCLKNEEETYEFLNQKMPKMGAAATTADGRTGKVIELNVLRQRVRVLFEEDDTKEAENFDVSELTFQPRKRREEGAQGRADGRKKKQDGAQGRADERPRKEGGAKSRPGERPEKEGGAQGRPAENPEKEGGAQGRPEGNPDETGSAQNRAAGTGTAVIAVSGAAVEVRAAFAMAAGTETPAETVSAEQHTAGRIAEEGASGRPADDRSGEAESSPYAVSGGLDEEPSGRRRRPRRRRTSERIPDQENGSADGIPDGDGRKLQGESASGRSIRENRGEGSGGRRFRENRGESSQGNRGENGQSRSGTENGRENFRDRSGAGRRRENFRDGSGSGNRRENFRDRSGSETRRGNFRNRSGADNGKENDRDRSAREDSGEGSRERSVRENRRERYRDRIGREDSGEGFRNRNGRDSRGGRPGRNAGEDRGENGQGGENRDSRGEGRTDSPDVQTQMKTNEMAIYAKRS